MLQSNDGYRVKSACYKKDTNKIELTTEKDCGKDILVAVGKYSNRVNETGFVIYSLSSTLTGLIALVGAFWRLRLLLTMESLKRFKPMQPAFLKAH